MDGVNDDTGLGRQNVSIVIFGRLSKLCFLDPQGIRITSDDDKYNVLNENILILSDLSLIIARLRLIQDKLS